MPITIQSVPGAIRTWISVFFPDKCLELRHPHVLPFTSVGQTQLRLLMTWMVSLCRLSFWVHQSCDRGSESNTRKKTYIYIWPSSRADGCLHRQTEECKLSTTSCVRPTPRHRRRGLGRQKTVCRVGCSRVRSRHEVDLILFPYFPVYLVLWVGLCSFRSRTVRFGTSCFILNSIRVLGAWLKTTSDNGNENRQLRKSRPNFAAYDCKILVVSQLFPVAKNQNVSG